MFPNQFNYSHVLQIIDAQLNTSDCVGSSRAKLVLFKKALKNDNRLVAKTINNDAAK
jgi:hypothetical protein